MMKLGKRIKALVVICMVIFSVGALSASSVLASSKYDVNYESTYDMTGGLYTRSSLVSKGKDICIAIAPTAGTSGCSMGIRLQKYDSDSGKWKHSGDMSRLK